MIPTTTRLADGREIVYFDDAPGADRAAVDTRDLAPATSHSELRHDPLLGEWVVVASHRQGRTHLPPTDACPLCPSTAGRATEIPSGDYDVVVFENRFPSLGAGVAADVDDGELADPALRRWSGGGRCEVVCFTSDHGASFGSLSDVRARTVVEAWAQRTSALSRRADVAQVFVFENRGKAIGVTLHHPHGQIYGYPFVTPRTRRMLDRAREHEERTGRGLLADVLAAEVEAARRIVTAGAHWTAYVPAAARWPFEVHLVPHRRVPDLPALDEAERAELAEVYRDLLARFDRVFDDPLPYVAAWYQAPVAEDRDLAHLHLQLFSIQRAPDKVKFLAGSESAMGVFINDVAPERAAELLRDAGPTSSVERPGGGR